MSEFYDNERHRGTAIRDLFAEYGIHPMQTTIEGTQYETDGDISYHNFRFVIFELKNEWGSTTSEPFFQAILYYLESTARQAPRLQGSALPCLIVLIAGWCYII